MKYFKWLLLTPRDIAKILGQRRRDRAVKFVLNNHKCRTAVLCGLEGRLRGNATAKTANILKRELRQFNGHTGRWDTKEGLAVGREEAAAIKSNIINKMFLTQRWNEIHTVPFKPFNYPAELR